MAKKPRTAITPTRVEDYPEWYQQVIKAADLAENSPVRGCMVIKPWGYALWENIKSILDGMFKATGHRNAYFPIFIPKSFLEKEAEHVEGFAKECAVVTHHRLEQGPEGGLVPAGELDEPLVIRPTSETIIGAMFAKWVQSYRDLPLLINQWANVVRWEMRTRMFLRTAEFLWQEGHTVHATEECAREETIKILRLYETFANDYMAMPVITGEKPEGERFPGAVATYSIEAMMQDRKALQAGTSHFLGQNFAKAQEIQYQDAQGKLVHAWTTSWGVSTRLIGGLIMTHSDDDGLVLPPRIAPAHVAIIPVIHNDEDRDNVLEYCNGLAADLAQVDYSGRPVEVEVDTRDLRNADKVWSWIKNGVPIRLEVGPRDIANDAVFMGRRDKGHKDKESMARSAFIENVATILQEIQDSLYSRALTLQQENTREIDTKEELYEFFTPENKEKPEVHGGFAMCHWDGELASAEQLQNDLNVTIRCIPDKIEPEAGTCVVSGKPSKQRVVMAKSY
jgi:prolyl-tRNA synthetase